MFGQPGLILWFAEKPALTHSTSEARSEELSLKATYKDPWRYGKSGFLRVLSFDGLCWETGSNALCGASGGPTANQGASPVQVLHRQARPATTSASRASG